jgi:glc operon protein GlcG
MTKNFAGPATLVAAMLAILAPSARADANRSDALRDAEQKITRCLDYAGTQKFPPMSVAVIDSSGTLIAFRRQAGAAPVTADAALLKAKTALRLGVATDLLGDVASDAQTRDAFVMLQLTTLPGGIPFASVDGKPVGAVGVSGGDAAQDTECAHRALMSVAGKPAASESR